MRLALKVVIFCVCSAVSESLDESIHQTSYVSHNNQSPKFHKTSENHDSRQTSSKTNSNNFAEAEPQNNSNEQSNRILYENLNDRIGYENQNSDQSTNGEKLREHYWTQMFLKHDRKQRRHQQLTYEQQSNAFGDNSKKRTNYTYKPTNLSENKHLITSIEIPVYSTPTTLYVMNSPQRENDDPYTEIKNSMTKEYILNQQHFTLPEEFNISQEKDESQENDAPKSSLYPQQPEPKPNFEIETKCSKQAIQVRITFDKPFDGIIYAKSHYNDESCHFVQHNSGLTVYEFTLRLNICGTKFYDDFEQSGESILENTLILQYEPKFLEVWDESRTLKCSWGATMDKTLQTSVNVDMLESKAITYTGDSIQSYMDILYGYGPNSSPVNGLVRIGDTLTLVVSVVGSDASNFDVHVKDCIAHDGDVENSLIQLTDENGCVIKKKLIGDWQKQNNGENVVSFAYMQAFRFPNQIEVFFECNIEICKYKCINECSEYETTDDRSETGFTVDHQKSRAKRMTGENFTYTEPIRLLKGIRVIVPNDFNFFNQNNTSLSSKLEIMGNTYSSVCVSILNFATILLLNFLTAIILSLIIAIAIFRYFERKTKIHNSLHGLNDKYSNINNCYKYSPDFK